MNYHHTTEKLYQKQTREDFLNNHTDIYTVCTMATTVQNNYTVPASTKEDEVKKNIDLNEKEKKLCFGLYENNPYGGYRRIFFEWIGLPTGIFFGVAYGVYNGNKAVYDANIALMFPNSWDGVYVSLALFIFVNTMFWVVYAWIIADCSIEMLQSTITWM